MLPQASPQEKGLERAWRWLDTKQWNKFSVLRRAAWVEKKQHQTPKSPNQTE